MECRIRKNSDAEIETEYALREDNTRKRKVEEMESEEELENLLFNNGDGVELSSHVTQMDLLSDYEDEPVDNQGNIVTI